MSREADGLEEPDRFPGTPHPRERLVLFGHEEAEAGIVEAMRAGRLPAAWLIGGPPGIGKATLAYRIARRLLALGGGPTETVTSLEVEPSHPVARQVGVLSHPNLIVIRRGLTKDGKRYMTEISAEVARRAIDMFGSTSMDGSYRIAIVDPAEELNAQSANALLKIIEEPPPRSLFLIVSHAPQRVLPTIRSRSRRLLLRPLAGQDVRRAVGSLGGPWAEAAPDVLDEAIRLGEGSVRRTLAMLDKDRIAFVDRIRRALDALPQLEAKGVLALAEQVARRDADETYELALDTVERWVSERLHERAALGPARLAPLVEVCDKLARQAREIDTYNLDRRPLVLSLFDDLADAVRRTA
ncbi:MAG TPA: DNA polymerase III subunit delta' [Microvirga sp.]|jgi:DNA polymerase-3 subunit delta'